MTSRIPKTVFLLLVSMIFTGLSAAQGESLPRQIQRHLPQVMDYLHQHQVKNVGVLKFRVRKPAQQTSSSVGPLNSLLADQLEFGLILANPFAAERQLNIFRDASAQAAEIENATHLTEEGRAVFFRGNFQVAWGDAALPADAFLTGIVEVHEDYRRATIGILCFHRAGGPLERACDVFEVDLDAASLGEMGESFVLRGAFDGGQSRLTFAEQQEKKRQKVLESAIRVKAQQNTFPHQDRAAPVTLEITYDDQPVAVEIRDGQAWIPEPQEGQHVQMALVRRASARGRYGVVLKVNGQNTLFRQTGRDLDCSKWIVSSDHPRIVVRGFQQENTRTAEQFRILSQNESARRAMDYGRYVGQIQLTVFPEQTGVRPPPRLPSEQDEDLLAMLRSVQPTRRPRNLSAMKGQLRTAGRDSSLLRGIIEGGAATASRIRTVKFKADPTPAMAMTVTYYRP